MTDELVATAPLLSLLTCTSCGRRFDQFACTLEHLVLADRIAAADHQESSC